MGKNILTFLDFNFQSMIDQVPKKLIRNRRHPNTITNKVGFIYTKHHTLKL